MNNTNYMIIDLATQQPTIKPIGDYLFARQGDNRRPLPIWFQQSGQPFALDGYTVEWAQKNADGTPLVVSGTTISGASVGQVVFFFPAVARRDIPAQYQTKAANYFDNNHLVSRNNSPLF